MRARAAWAALISIISVYVIAGVLFRDGEALASATNRNEVIAMAKLGETVGSESVVVPNLSPDINPQLPALSLAIKAALARGETTSLDAVPALSHGGAGGNYVLPLEPFIDDWEVAQKPFIAEHSINKPAHITSRQIAYILNADIAGDKIAGNEWREAKWLNRDIGPLENSGIESLSLYASVGGNPEANRGDGQHAGKRDKPQGEIRRWVAGGLFPEPVMFALLGGAIIGCFIVAIAGYGVKKRKGYKQPERKKE